MKLHDIEGRNTYCGPAAIAAIAGITTDEAADLIASRREHDSYYKWWNPVRRCGTKEVTDVLQCDLDFWVRFVTADARRPITLKRFLDGRKPDDLKTVYLVNVTGHFVVIRGSILADNCHRRGELIEDVGRLRRRVKNAWKVLECER